MEKLLYICILALLLLSCEEDIEHPLAEQSWPVVHCLLDADDSVHYLRLGKTFSGMGLNEVLQDPDTLYYSDALVFFDFFGTGGGLLSVQLEPTEELERAPGIFPASPHRLYKTNYPIPHGRGIAVRIELPEINWYVKGTVWVRSQPRFKYPNPEYKKVLDFYEEEHVRIEWNGFPKVCETTVRLKYLEITENGMDTCHLDWTRYSYNFVLLGEEWIDFMLYMIKEDRHVLVRRILGIDILASGGNEQCADYLVYKDWVIDLIDKPYSNLINAHGILASRASGGLYNYLPDQEFIDTLAHSAKTERLKFVEWIE